jgi:hypothetical protein
LGTFKGRVDARAGTLKLGVAELGEPLAAFPEREGVFQREAACLELADDVSELVTGSLVV